MFRFPFLPDTLWARAIALWATVTVEAALPVLLTFRRTRWMGIVLGLSFHFLLGTIGHRTFSALAYAAYALFCIGSLTSWVERVQALISKRWTRHQIDSFVVCFRTLVVVLAVLVVAPDLATVRSGFRAVWLIWVFWSVAVALVYLSAIVSDWRQQIQSPQDVPSAAPGLLWLVVPLVAFNGLTSYSGLKTQTNFTMYSNLRTETENNHYFMPALRFSDLQDDIVTISSTNVPSLLPYIDDEVALTYFEFRRVISEAEGNTQVEYERGGRLHIFELRDGVATDTELREHPTWLGKLLYFRPVEMGQKTRCRH